jgi:hypothetical protein
MARPVDERLHSVRFAFEDSLDRTILSIGDPPRHPMSPRFASAGVAEEHTLHASVGNDSAPDHGTSVDHRWPHAGGK